ncbi:hypothetical protein CJF30_00001354 [Rutstroemia sp. NJR-2017a BBW]|nr:hypothetical protein CJF30_00001354 [Rutstroemia sp. NJR-2017a BBW]
MQKLRLCLELNEKSVSAAVATFIQLKKAIQQHLMLNANDTFLWVALVCQELSSISGWKALQKLKVLPPGLDALYQRMLDQIIDSEDAELCKSILAVVSAVYRPITLDELVAFVDIPNGVTGDYEALSEIIGLCGSFLTLRERTVSFVHQSAKDFLIEKASKDIFLSIIENYGTPVSIGLTICLSVTLEGLCIITLKTAAQFIIMIRKLEDWAQRFALYSRSVIEQTPLQSYCSALVFAPEKSIVRTTFEKCIPPWIQKSL